MENKTEKKDNRRRIEGVVTGNSMEKTVKVRVDTLEAHPVYKKRVKRKKVYFAHTEEQTAKEAMRLAGHKFPVPPKR